jgi:pSer/pThr/pTyr-binding forkhead associated (FHA) protein
MKILLMINDMVLKEYLIDQNETIIGRDSSCDIPIDNIAVSREHARITREHSHINEGPGDYFVEDMGSINGTFVNGRKVDKKLLNTGDEITIGKHFLMVHFDDDPAAVKNKQIDEVYSTYRMAPNDFEKIFKKHSK